MITLQPNWTTTTEPLLCLAPMEGVTDTVFRQLLVEIGKPPIMFTEFTGVEQLYSPGFKSVIQNFEYTDSERPIIAQIWGITPELYYNVTQLVVELGFDGVDINMGCPQRAITKRGACSALIKDKSLASEIIIATKEAAQGKIPVSVKTRIGYERIITDEWIGFLLQHDLDALTIHGRTAAEMSAVPTHWDEIKYAVTLRDEMEKPTKIIGNGDVESLSEAINKTRIYTVDGVMMGRGIFKNPWLFADRPIDTVSKQEKLTTLLRHVELWETVWGGDKHFERLKRFFKIYINAFPNAVELREKVMDATSLTDAKALVFDALQ